ncbi:hypothetical protein PIROE2DRAFT_16693 [Piromyces sp. E2]|nr:hypothetical protein PIROE2DRAFT_16693 [Piromyces sp. E2]|eukprot:OUM58112.1 hypothetical protein PIROE2DRAFT_16693 [Piromyces sp. E2]
MYRCLNGNDLSNTKIISTIFKNNHAQNGGAIYYNSHNNEIKIINSKFIENKAEYFGGAIFTLLDIKNIISNIENTSIEYNRAYIGGAIYTKNDNNKNNNSNINNNKNELYNNISFTNNNYEPHNHNFAESHGNNFASSPYKVKLITPFSVANVTSGEAYPLEFILIDELDQTFVDKFNYHLNLNLIIKEDNSDGEFQNDIKLVGNSCHFSDGIK